jgi:small subunit ribosomal protein S16
MLMIRLQRVGRKHEPVFRLVLTDSKNGPKSGRFLEILGSYDARRGEKAEFKTERVKELISTGAQLSDTVHNLLITMKVIEGKKINKLPKKKAIVKEKPPEAEAPKVEAASEESKPEEVKEEKTEAVATETAA